MPYAIAHPAAVIPLHRWLGRHSVPSALAIGSVVPDAWYFVALLDRPDTHTALGVLLYCLPLALLAYAAFHLLLKQPLLALFPPALAAKLRAYTSAGLPAQPWGAVVVCTLAGAFTHVAWDALTHEGRISAHFLPVLEARLFAIHGYEVRVHQLLQHASTLLGAGFLAWWLRAKLSRTVPAALAAALPAARPAHPAVGPVLLALPVIVFVKSLLAVSPGPGVEALRGAVRAAAVSAAAALGLACIAYCVYWHCRTARSRSSA